MHSNRTSSAPLPDELRAPEMLLIPEWLLLPQGPVRDHAVVIGAGRFGAVGPTSEICTAYPHLPATRLPRRLLMPGFIDAHHHLTQSFGKALAFGEPSEIYRRIWVPMERCLDEKMLHLSARLAAWEALRGGFTTVCDAGTRSAGNIGAIASACHEVGLRCVLGLICNDATEAGPMIDRHVIMEAAETHLARWEHDGLVHPSLAISIPEAATDGTLNAVAAMCRDAGAVFQTHINEHLASVERSLVRRHMRPLELLAHVGALGPQTLLAHAALVTPSELNLLRGSGAAVSYNPVASQWKGNAVAPALQMDALGIRLGLGTDGTRSDAFRLMDAAEASQRLSFGLATGDSSCGGGALWLAQATRGGADAVGLGQVIGQIATGRWADCLIVDLDVPEMVPSWDLTWELVRLANRSQIEAVFVAGELRLWQGWPLDWDGAALMAEAAQAARDVIAQADIQKIHDAPSIDSLRHFVSAGSPEMTR